QRSPRSPHSPEARPAHPAASWRLAVTMAVVTGQPHGRHPAEPRRTCCLRRTGCPHCPRVDRSLTAPRAPLPLPHRSTRAHRMATSLETAAGATGTVKSKLLRAIKAGKVSAIRDEHGQWRIEPAELHRVYPVAVAGNGAGNGASNTTHRA